jgi:hypothetical protein
MPQIVSISCADDVHPGYFEHIPMLAEAEIRPSILNEIQASIQRGAFI